MQQTGINISVIPSIKGVTHSTYDQYLEYAMEATYVPGEGVPVPVKTNPTSTVSGINQIIRRRNLPLRVHRRGEQVFVARREE